MSKFKGFFTDWKIDKFEATSPDKTKCFWIASGFCSFDDSDFCLTAEPVIKGLSWWQKRLLWRELERELCLRLMRDHQKEEV